MRIMRGTALAAFVIAGPRTAGQTQPPPQVFALENARHLAVGKELKAREDTAQARFTKEVRACARADVACKQKANERLTHDRCLIQEARDRENKLHEANWWALQGDARGKESRWEDENGAEHFGRFERLARNGTVWVLPIYLRNSLGQGYLLDTLSFREYHGASGTGRQDYLAATYRSGSNPPVDVYGRLRPKLESKCPEGPSPP